MSQVLQSTEFVHNTDLNPADEYLSTAPRLKLVLRHPALLEVFTRYERIANLAQRRLRLTGIASLWLGGIALVGITLELLIAALGTTVPKPSMEAGTSMGASAHSGFPYVSVFFEACAVVAILLALGPWFSRTRARWLAARFMTEQIRQWHFQMFLDGTLVEKAHTVPTQFEAERDKRWARFMALAPNAEGAMNAFVNSESVELHHRVESYTDRATAAEVLNIYLDLRFEKQLAYFTFRRDYFAERDDWSEAVARSALFLAVLIAAAQLGVTIVRWSGLAALPHEASVYMFAAAIVFSIVSASVRVYRGAMALSPQRERYETKWVRLVALRAAFGRAATVELKQDIMREVELVEVEELREFLRQMRRASYLL